MPNNSQAPIQQSLEFEMASFSQVTSSNFVQVEAEKPYKITFTKKLSEQLPNISGFLEKASQVVVVTHQHLKDIYSYELEQLLGTNIHHLCIETGDEQKNATNLFKILDFFSQQGLSRKALVIIFGGGMLGDLVGFSASIYMRGIACIQLPTSLLAMVDSSVGGKTGINTQHGKNLVGSFSQPLAVGISLDVLASLAQREFLSGMAEVVKYALIADKSFVDWLLVHKNSLLTREYEKLTSIIQYSCLIKARIVALDEKEQGLRAVLNFGHTFGHALEKLDGYSSALLHGEAVMEGMLIALFVACHLGLLEEARAQMAREAIKCFQSIPSSSPIWQPKTLVKAMQNDKKNIVSNEIRLVLLKDIAKACLVSIDSNKLESILELYLHSCSKPK